MLQESSCFNCRNSTPRRSAHRHPDDHSGVRIIRISSLVSSGARRSLPGQRPTPASQAGNSSIGVPFRRGPPGEAVPSPSRRGNFPESTHQGRSDALIPVRELRLQVADNTPVRDERAGTRLRATHPARAPPTRARSIGFGWGRGGIKWIGGPAADFVDPANGKRAAPPTFVTAIQHAVRSCRTTGSASPGLVS